MKHPVICTICCREKRQDLEPLPAIERYRSERIQNVYRQSQLEGLGFLIFSGKLGLLEPQSPIQYYDYRLEAEAVAEITPLLVTQLRNFDMRHLIFVGKGKEVEGWEPYYAAIEQACALAGVELEFRAYK